MIENIVSFATQVFNFHVFCYCTVGWSDLALFSIFENVHISADQVYFQALHLKNRQFRVFILNNSQGP